MTSYIERLSFGAYIRMLRQLGYAGHRILLHALAG